MDFAVARESRASGIVLAVHGELDIATVKALRTEVEAALSAAPAAVYLDLSATTFIDSTGCRELARAARSGAAAAVPVQLVVPRDHWRVRRVLDFMQFGELLPIHEEAPSA